MPVNDASALSDVSNEGFVQFVNVADPPVTDAVKVEAGNASTPPEAPPDDNDNATG